MPQPPAATPQAPASVDVRLPGPDGVFRSVSMSPANAYQGAVKQRDELASQVEQTVDKRDDVARELRETPASTEPGLRARLTELDQQVLAGERQLAQANERVAQLAGIPGAVVEVPRTPRDHSPEIAAMMVVGSCILLFPLAIAWARRLWRQAGQPPAPALPREVAERMTRMEQALDTVAIEIERMSESQRYLTRVMTEDGRGLGPGPAQPVDAKARETVAAEPSR